LVDDAGNVRYVEPAVLIGRSPDTVARTLRLFSEYTEADGGLIDDAVDVKKGDGIQRTLVIIKPDNFRYPSQRPGNIIDIFSASGLRIIGAKVHRMSVAEALEFYGPVQEVLRTKLKGLVAERASKAFATEFAFTIPDEAKKQIGDLLGPLFGDQQFYQIVQFMTGLFAPEVPEADRTKPGRERCLVLIYSGSNAVEKIRKILGPTDPSKAEPGSVRKEFGQNIMVNAAHASDSADNAKREMGIVRPDLDTIRALVQQYYPA
jgi:nucleoside diphosphate kinase